MSEAIVLTQTTLDHVCSYQYPLRMISYHCGNVYYIFFLV